MERILRQIQVYTHVTYLNYVFVVVENRSVKTRISQEKGPSSNKRLIRYIKYLYKTFPIFHQSDHGINTREIFSIFRFRFIFLINLDFIEF